MEQSVYRATAERRRDQRHHIDIEGRFIGEDGVTQPTIVRNISVYGALLSGVTPPQVGTRATLILPYLERNATLIWRAGAQCGLLFDHPVDPVVVLASSRSEPLNNAGVTPRVQ